jgi:hypothetical protein
MKEDRGHQERFRGEIRFERLDLKDELREVIGNR